MLKCPDGGGILRERELFPGENVPLQEKVVVGLKEGHGLLQRLFAEVQTRPFVNGETACLFQQPDGAQRQNKGAVADRRRCTAAADDAVAGWRKV